MYYERIMVIIRQTDSYAIKGDATKGDMGLKNLTSPKHLEIKFFQAKGYYIINNRLQIT